MAVQRNKPAPASQGQRRWEARSQGVPASGVGAESAATLGDPGAAGGAGVESAAVLGDLGGAGWGVPGWMPIGAIGSEGSAARARSNACRLGSSSAVNIRLT